MLPYIPNEDSEWKQLQRDKKAISFYLVAVVFVVSFCVIIITFTEKDQTSTVTIGSIVNLHYSQDQYALHNSEHEDSVEMHDCLILTCKGPTYFTKGSVQVFHIAIENRCDYIIDQVDSYFQIDHHFGWILDASVYPDKDYNTFGKGSDYLSSNFSLLEPEKSLEIFFRVVVGMYQIYEGYNEIPDPATYRLMAVLTVNGVSQSTSFHQENQLYSSIPFSRNLLTIEDESSSENPNADSNQILSIVALVISMFFSFLFCVIFVVNSFSKTTKK